MGAAGRQYFRHADTALPRSQSPAVRLRLGECARRIVSLATAQSAESTNQDAAEFPDSVDAKIQANSAGNQAVEFSCSLEEEVLRYERDLIKRALETSGGSVTRAARQLGITHQGLAFILNGRHKSLLSARKPAKPRRRSIIRYH